MQFKQFFIALCALPLLFIACNKNDDITTSSIEDNSSLIQVMLDNGSTLEYNFDECAFTTILQNSGGGYGTIGVGEPDRWDMKSLLTRMYNRDEGHYLQIQFEFKQPASNGEIDRAVMENILSTEINSDNSAHFAITVGIELNNGATYSNRMLFSHLEDDARYYTYDDFDYNITEYEFGYQVDCLDREAIKLKGNISGTLYRGTLFYPYTNGEPIQVEIPDFEMLLLL